MKQDNFNNLKNNLSSEDIAQIVSILGYRCRTNTVHRLKAMLTYGTSIIPQFGILDRLMKENGKWTYYAGQSYVDEIRTVRNIIIKGK